MRFVDLADRVLSLGVIKRLKQFEVVDAGEKELLLENDLHSQLQSLKKSAEGAELNPEDGNSKNIKGQVAILKNLNKCVALVKVNDDKAELVKLRNKILKNTDVIDVL